MRLCPECDHGHDAGVHQCPECGWSPPRIDGFAAYAPDLDAAGAAGFKPEAFAELARHEEGSFWFRARNRLILWAVGRYAPGFRNLLEIGCGTGFVLAALVARFPDAQFTGSEIFTRGLAFAAKRVPGVRLCQMDARQIGHRDEFDVIGAFDVLEHIAEDTVVLDQIRQALVPGGVLLLTVPQHRWLWSHSDDYACHVRRYTAAELTRKLRDSGFAIERSTSFVSLLLPAMLLSRVLQRRSLLKDFDPTAEFRLNPLLNAVFLGLMQVEIALIRAGLSLPFGGSRLVVARKSGAPND